MEEKQMPKISCSECRGECCRKIAFQIPAPVTLTDFEDIKWYIYHENALVYIDNDGDWLVQVPLKCTKLDSEGRCIIYEDRPPICRMSRTEDCEMNSREMDVVFRNALEVDEYARQATRRKALKEPVRQ